MENENQTIYLDKVINNNKLKYFFNFIFLESISSNISNYNIYLGSNITI